MNRASRIIIGLGFIGLVSGCTYSTHLNPAHLRTGNATTIEDRDVAEEAREEIQVLIPQEETDTASTDAVEEIADEIDEEIQVPSLPEAEPENVVLLPVREEAPPALGGPHAPAVVVVEPMDEGPAPVLSGSITEIEPPADRVEEPVPPVSGPATGMNTMDPPNISWPSNSENFVSGNYVYNYVMPPKEEFETLVAGGVIISHPIPLPQE